jgi:hypothetical protein
MSFPDFGVDRQLEITLSLSMADFGRRSPSWQVDFVE